MVASQTVWVFVCEFLNFITFFMICFAEMLAGPTLYSFLRKNTFFWKFMVFKGSRQKPCKTIRRVVNFSYRRGKKTGFSKEMLNSRTH